MKKAFIVLIALMVISLGFVNSCSAGREECGTCDGTGKCNRCGGTGWAVDWDLECDKCHGSGDCQTCGGTGYIETGIGGTGVPGFEAIYLLVALSLVTGILLFNKKRKRR
ncbi:MAG: hypothetical protein ACTSSH_11470 [Candidatus Heimdallarchaeota archaeon]